MELTTLLAQNDSGQVKSIYIINYLKRIQLRKIIARRELITETLFGSPLVLPLS